jgi:hypothetical protein
MNKCSAITNAGERCKSIAISGSDYCNAHHPDRAEARKRAASKAARAGGRGRPKLRVDEVYRLADEQIKGLFDRSVDPRRSAVAVQWANTKLRAMEVERKLVEVAELEQKVAEIERLYKQRREVGNDSDYPFGGGVWVG